MHILVVENMILNYIQLHLTESHLFIIAQNMGPIKHNF